MRRPDGTWIKPPPTYEPIQTMCKYFNGLHSVFLNCGNTSNIILSVVKECSLE